MSNEIKVNKIINLILNNEDENYFERFNSNDQSVLFGHAMSSERFNEFVFEIEAEEEKARTVSQIINENLYKNNLGPTDLAKMINAQPSYITNLTNNHSVGKTDKLFLIAIKLELSFEEAEELLAAAGKAFNINNCKDRVIRMALAEKVYEEEDINRILKACCGTGAYLIKKERE